MRLSRGGAIDIWCQLMPNSNVYTEIQITCTDQQNDLVYGWIVQVYAYAPKRGWLSLLNIFNLPSYYVKLLIDSESYRINNRIA